MIAASLMLSVPLCLSTRLLMLVVLDTSLSDCCMVLSTALVCSLLALAWLLPLSVKNLAVYVMTQTPAKKYNFLGTPLLILVQANGYRPESLAFYTTKHAEGMGMHTDGPSVDQSKPKIHIYVKMDGTLIIVLKTNKDDSHRSLVSKGAPPCCYQEVGGTPSTAGLQQWHQGPMILQSPWCLG